MGLVVGWGAVGSTLYRLLGEEKVVWGFAPVAHLS